MKHCTVSTKPLRTAAPLASSSALCYSHRLRMASGAAAPAITLHCSSSKAALLSQGGSRLGQHAGRHLSKDPDGPGRAAPHSCCLRLLPLAPPVMTGYFFVAFQKRILKFDAALRKEPSGPVDSSGNTPLPVAPDESGRKSDSCLVSCLPLPAGD